MMHPSFEVEREYVVRVRAPEGEERSPTPSSTASPWRALGRRPGQVRRDRTHRRHRFARLVPRRGEGRPQPRSAACGSRRAARSAA
jgi:SRSO17 transposase